MPYCLDYDASVQALQPATAFSCFAGPLSDGLESSNLPRMQTALGMTYILPVPGDTDEERAMLSGLSQRIFQMLAKVEICHRMSILQLDDLSSPT